jgi:hypothetical protein
MSSDWPDDLKPLGTDWQTFSRNRPSSSFSDEYMNWRWRQKKNNYYVQESGIAAGFLLAAIHQVGLVSLTHTSSPMNFLTKTLSRPENETVSTNSQVIRWRLLGSWQKKKRTRRYLCFLLIRAKNLTLTKATMKKKLTKKDISQEVFDLYDDDYITKLTEEGSLKKFLFAVSLYCSFLT